MNPFDAAVYLLALVAMVTGFNAGLLRSLATILAYALAAPIALALTPRLAVMIGGHAAPTPLNTALLFSGVFLVIGMLLGAAARLALSELTGAHIGFADRLLGALLGAARIRLLAVLIVLIFNRIIPAGREPSWLAQSQLKPYLAAAGEQGLRSLPPETAAYIDRLKRERGL